MHGIAVGGISPGISDSRVTTHKVKLEVLKFKNTMFIKRMHADRKEKRRVIEKRVREVFEVVGIKDVGPLKID